MKYVKHHGYVLGAAVRQIFTKVGTTKQSKLSDDNYMRFKCLNKTDTDPIKIDFAK